MINWELLSPRNLFVIGTMSVIAYAIYAYFSKQSAPQITEAVNG